MLPEYLLPLVDQIPAFNIFRYISFRTGGAILTSLLICFVLGPSFIKFLRKFQESGQPIREDGPSEHIIKKIGSAILTYW